MLIWQSNHSTYQSECNFYLARIILYKDSAWLKYLDATYKNTIIFNDKKQSARNCVGEGTCVAGDPLYAGEDLARQLFVHVTLAQFRTVGVVMFVQLKQFQVITYIHCSFRFFTWTLGNGDMWICQKVFLL